MTTGAPAAPTWPGLLSDAARAASDLDAEPTPPGRWSRSCSARPPRCRSPAFVVALRAKGETPDEVTGLVARDARRRRPDRRRRARPSTSSAPAATGPTRSTSPRWRRWSSPAPAPGWSSTATGAASSACGSADVLEELGVVVDLAPRRGRRVPSSGRHHLLLRAAVPPGAAARGRSRGASSASHGLQLPRPADQPGPAAARRRSAAPTRGMAGVMAAGARRPRRVGAGVPRRRRAGRAHPDDDLAGLGGRATATSPASRSTRATSGCRAADAGRRCAAATRPTTPRSPGGSWPARPGRCATRCCSTPRRRWSRWTPGGGTTRWPSAAGDGLRARRRVGRQRCGRGRWPAGSRPAAAGSR